MNVENNLKVERISKDQYHLLVDWNEGKDESYLFQWAGPDVYRFPITIEQIETRVTQENAHIYIALEGGTPVGSVELDTVDITGGSANVCRFILNEKVKSKGMGTNILKLLSQTAFGELGLNRLTLSVYCYNAGAIRCYEKCGFLVKKYHRTDDPDWSYYDMELLNKNI